MGEPREPREPRDPGLLELARIMADLHNVDVDSVGLSAFGRPGNYYERQIGRWSKHYLASKTEEI